MPKFTIHERVSAWIEIEAPTAEEAQHLHMEGRAGSMDETVEERWIEDENGNIVGLDNADHNGNGCPECSRSNGPHYRGPCNH